MNDCQKRGAASVHPHWFILAAGAVLCLSGLSCSIGQALVGQQAEGPTPTKTLWPTFTPIPGVRNLAVTPGVPVRGVLPPGVTVEPPGGSQGATGEFTGTLSLTPGAVEGSTSLILFATPTPTPSPTVEATSTPGPTAPPTPDTETNRPTREAGPRALPTPYVVVNSATVTGRRGPGLTFERLGEAQKGDELMLLARTTDEKWWQVCCLANQPAWVSADLVTAKGPLEGIPAQPPPPTPRPTPRPPPPPTRTVAPTPLPPFDVSRGPERYITVDTGTMTIWVKVYEGKAPYERLLQGYTLKVLRDGVDVTQLNNVRDAYPSSHDLVDHTNFGKAGDYEYNYKFEMVNAGEADWEIYLADAGGTRVSPVTKFTTKGDLYRNLVAYIAYWLAR